MLTRRLRLLPAGTVLLCKLGLMLVHRQTYSSIAFVSGDCPEPVAGGVAAWSSCNSSLAFAIRLLEIVWMGGKSLISRPCGIDYGWGAG